MEQRKKIDYNYEFHITLHKHEPKEPKTFFLLEILVDKYLPAQTDHICYEDYLIMQRNILYLLSDKIGSEIRMVNISQKMVKRTKFHGEKFSIFCEIIMLQKKQNVYEINLDFIKDNKPIFEVTETLLIKN
jgi:hypothetical protein